jgi:L-threonylcarbamoyladenylate synthase
MEEPTRPRAADIVKRGGVIAFRTDTFYGLGADPFNRSGVKRIKELKGREDTKPILLLISNLRHLPRLIKSRSKAFEVLARELWPGPITIIGAASDDLPEGITSGTGTVGVRLPADDKVRAVVDICGGVLTATSANPSGASPGESAQQVQDYFPSGIDLVIDGGPVKATQPSTVVDATTDVVKVVRAGAVSNEAIREALATAGLTLATNSSVNL